ncbi:tRNA 2'-phosphotransferase 1-like [Mercenaria mercenaria]|uniref:tRNA 2'-phosphotransferase 1-like n=1 Tax=Mercenaria mercenaria TaxID=6596 RepID=UPI00234EE173|nr:tRNA 2'-phosphotransferase 1-like [Mercenaria mercenaria]
MSDLNRLSRFLAKLLRHEATSRGLDITPEGYVVIEDVLRLPEARSFKVSDIEKIVANDSKGRFKIRTHCGTKQIKATQAHSIQLESPELTPINHYSDARVVLHGTKTEYWPSIKAEGLSRKTRTHIHFAEGERVQSGFPPNCDMVIEINLELALKDGLKFYKSENAVILCAGNINGVISPRYFKRAYNLHTRESIKID